LSTKDVIDMDLDVLQDKIDNSFVVFLDLVRKVEMAEKLIFFDE
jgi:hypothetical protein